MVPLPPKTLRVKYRVLKISKCTWSGCYVVASLELQAHWINVGVLYIWKSTQVTNNHVKEFRSMLLPNKALCSNVVTLVWLVVPIWNPIALSLSFGLGSSQMAEAWWYTRPGPSPWKACDPGKETKVGQALFGFPIVFTRNQWGFFCLVTSWQELWSSNMWKTYRLGSLMVYLKTNYRTKNGARLIHQLHNWCA
jgi:hypothetical protein